MDQFNSLGDFSDLQGLHVYGDLLRLYDLRVHATIAETGALYREIQDLERRLLTVYVLYVLANRGYYVKTFTEEDFNGKLYTSRFKLEDWVENFDLFQPGEELPASGISNLYALRLRVAREAVWGPLGFLHS